MVRFYDDGYRIGTEMLSILLLACLVLALLISGCEKKSDNTDVISDKPLAAFQNELLDIAFETATSIPVKPHIKDRSKAQEAVVTTCLELDQPKRAFEFIEKIDDWRRGLCYADLAFYCAQHGNVNEIQHYLNLAAVSFELTNQDWQQDRIRVKIAQTHALLGQIQKADEFEKGVEDSESGKVARARAMISDKDSFDEQMKMLDMVIASGIFDKVKNALESSTELFNRFYDDVKRRTLVEDKIKSSWNILPVFIRIDILMELAGFALEHSDNSKALKLVNEAQTLIDSNQWPSENRISMTAKLVVLRFRASDMEKARTDANTVGALFDEQRENIVNIYRAGVIRPLAEAYQSMGDTNTALSVYKQAVEEGTTNLNSRPRAEDLSATCCSMALHAVEPDDVLWMRIRQIREALGEPW